jgi:predicted methyltransferase
MPTLLEALRPVVPYNWQTDYLIKQIRKGVYVKELGLTLDDENANIEIGHSMKMGVCVWTAHDFGNLSRKLLKTAMVEETTEVVCPTCNGKGVVYEDL